mmetsp:Transcript_17831/g.60820  ORF Transcript_17831/g.60820 Transcript_17831/m.60820 type:complete len:494 (-) Transcript_17831:262-1743(-)|eukprot:CAMPEP_0183819564 /NCGR_PEP_ID=MMETSP0803_2-20130417/64204_1 /TAXON_ID=195967 /ORGANISM="Crustomastix stigmata, Strain CCMP3273" /LENGTH=493 /DNA_ID=CAMNT_0026064453 /DNA_START=217 /DNA_END=1698 /DNA_ORIENTATION=+
MVVDVKTSLEFQKEHGKNAGASRSEVLILEHLHSKFAFNVVFDVTDKNAWYSKVCPVPLFLEKEYASEVQNIVVPILEGIETVLDLLLIDDAVLQQEGELGKLRLACKHDLISLIPPNKISFMQMILQTTRRDKSVALSRLDLMIDEAGRMHVAEVNAGCIGLPVFAQGVQSLMQEKEGVPKFLSDSGYEFTTDCFVSQLTSYIGGCFHTWSKGAQDVPKTAIFINSCQADGMPILHALVAAGFKILVCDQANKFTDDPFIQEAVRFEGGKLWLNTVQVSLVFCTGLWHTMRRSPLVIKHIMESTSGMGAILRSWEKNAVCFMPDQSYVMSSNKGILSMLYDKRYQQLFPKRVQGAIARYIPETRLLSHSSLVSEYDSFKEQLLREKDAWVLKPIAESGGYDVVVGKDVTQLQWSKRVAQVMGAQRGLYVAQAYIECIQSCVGEINEKFIYARLVLGPVFVGNKLTGTLARASFKKTVNTSSGGFDMIVAHKA